MRYLLGFLVLTNMATAQTALGVRDSDTLLAPAALTTVLSGNIVRFHDGGFATFGPDGQYAYAYDSGDQIWRGVYEVREDSLVCVDFDNGFSRCDTYIKDGERLILITDSGDRYPAKSIDAQ